MSASPGKLPHASIMDTARILAAVVVPTVAEGVIVRRPPVLRLAAKLDLDRRANQMLHRMRDRYGPGPLLVRLPGRRLALVLSPEHAGRVLAETPDPFLPANTEKHGAMAKFEPDAVLISPRELRPQRRVWNEAVLHPDATTHPLTPAFLNKINDETTALLGRLDRNGSLSWNQFSGAMWKTIRRVVLGDGARDDHELTRLLASLRRAANWSYLHPMRRKTYEAFTGRLTAHLDRAEPGSLAALVRSTPASVHVHPDGQVPHWLFAFDAAVIAAYRALALVAGQPGEADRVRAELDGRDLTDPDQATALIRLRAAMLESLRLWPTALVILRDSTTETLWDGSRLPAGAALTLLSSFFHRHSQVLPDPDRFHPEAWINGHAHDLWALMPFSHGPAGCPGRNIVLLVTTTLLGSLLQKRTVTLENAPELSGDRPLPCSTNHTALQFTLHQVSGRSTPERSNAHG